MALGGGALAVVGGGASSLAAEPGKSNVPDAIKVEFKIIENQWIPMKDGTRLAARIWMPDVAKSSRVPAVLEFLPYRKRNGTERRDEVTYSAFAEAGIAGVRVDIRGTGESEGIIDGEYTPLEFANAVAVIDWIADQPWSNGNVGMMGISWGGFNCLQVAALKPKPLKAVISLSSTVDRYNDDIHYKNGCHLSAQLNWAASMLSSASRPPDPQIVGERWRSMWLQRLEGEPFFMADWLSHQRRNAFWRHGSINEAFDDVSIPALVGAGWADGYRNTPLKAVEGMPENAKALIGPWAHLYPHIARPGPSYDFLGEAIAWWHCWLGDKPNGSEEIPAVRAFILDGLSPAARRNRDPGYWIAKQTWEAPKFRELTLNAEHWLSDSPTSRPTVRVLLRSPLDTGLAGGDWWATTGSQFAGDQRIDDAGSLSFETASLSEECVLLGMPSLRVTLSSDSPLANIAARLIDVRPDGTEARVSYGVLNLSHRLGDADPLPLTPGLDESIEVSLDACGYRFAPGHKIKLAISTAYWPIVLPPPIDATLSLDLSGLSLSLPLIGDHTRIELPEPSNHTPTPEWDVLKAGGSKRWIERDLEKGITRFCKSGDAGLTRNPGTGWVTGGQHDEEWAIALNNPLSMTGRVHAVSTNSLPNWETKTDCSSKLSCTQTEWVIEESITAYLNGEQVFERSRNRRIPRDLM